MTWHKSQVSVYKHQWMYPERNDGTCDQVSRSLIAVTADEVIGMMSTRITAYFGLFFLTVCAISTAFGIDIKESASMKIAEGVTATPTRAGWMVSSQKRVKVLSHDLKPVVNRRIKGNQRFIHSVHGGCFGILKYNDHSPTTFSLLRISMFDKSGEALWSVDKPEASSVVLSDVSGRAVGIVGAEGLSNSTLDLYSPEGRLENSIPVTHLFELAFDATGEFLYVNSADSGLRVYDSSARLKVDHGYARKFCISDDGGHVVTTNSDKLSYFKDGTRLQTTALDFDESNPVVSMMFDPEGTAVLVLKRRGLSIHRLPTLETVWEHGSEDVDRRYTGLDCSADGRIAIGYDQPKRENGKKTHTQGGVDLLSSDGSLIWNREFHYSRWGREFPMVCFTPDGAGIQIATAEEAFLFRISH